MNSGRWMVDGNITQIRVSRASQPGGEVIKYSRGEAGDHQVRNECDDGTVYCTQPSPPLTTFY